MFLKLFNPVAFLLPWCAPLAGLFAMAGVLGTMADNLSASINSLAAAMRGMPGSGLVAMANTMFPVSEAIGIFSLLLTLRISCVVFRMVKSWIPTVN